MNTQNIMQTSALDLLFADRNKSYGAYQLRKNYNKRLLISLLTMISICLFSSAVFKWNAVHQTASSTLLVSGEYNLIDIKTEKKPLVQPPVVKIKPIEQHQATTKFTIPKLVNENVTPPPTQDNLTNVKIDIQNKDGNRNNVVEPPMEQGINGGNELVKTEDYTKEFHSVEKLAQFPGGLDGWTKYLTHNLRSEIPSDNGAPVGNYTVYISFLVDRLGNISEVRAANDPGYGIAAEAIRVIQRGPKWNPAEQNGNPVIYRQTQSITFVVSEP